MSGMGNWLEEKLLGYTFCRSAFSIPNTLYLALCTSITSDGDSRTEVTTNIAYARIYATFHTPNNPAGTTVNSPTNTFAAATSPWGTVSWVALVDTLTIGEGNTWVYGLLDVARNVQTSDTLQFTNGNLTIQFN